MTDRETLNLVSVKDRNMPPLYVTYDPVEGLWETAHDYTVNLRWGNETHTLTIPAFYETDLSSIPRVVWPLIAPHELSLVAPLVHDYLYDNYGCLGRMEAPDGGWQCQRLITRLDVDNIFLELMRRSEVPKWRRYLAYQAVRAFGSFPWDKNKPES